MFVIPFANQIGPTSGPATDGVIFGTLPRVVPVTALSRVHLVPFTKVLRGNADASSNVTWSNVTTAANDDTAGDVSLFDTVNPTADRLCIELSSGDKIDGISFLVSTAAVLTGTVAAIVRYKGTDNAWKTASAVVTPSLTSTGLKKVGFTAISYDDVALTDDLLNPIANPQMRCLFVEFSGITAVTTAPLFTRVWKNLDHSVVHKAANFTALISQGNAPDFSAAQATILPVANDLTLFGFDERPLRLFPSIYRPSNTGHVKEWVYSRASDFAAVPAANINDQSTRLEAALAAQNVASHNLTSTLASAAWGSSGVGSTTSLNGDGYVEFKVGATATLGGMIGFSTSDANNNYTSIGWAIHFGHASTAASSVWVNGAQQTAAGTWAIATGDVLRLDRKGGIFSAYHNGTLKHTFSQTSTANMVVDTAFINLSGVTDLHLVRTHLGYNVDVPITWGTTTALTLAAGANIDIGGSVARQIPLVPPTDWAKQSLTDTSDVAHNRYWVGLRTTADTVSPVLPSNFTLRGQVALGAGNAGIPAPETTTYTRATVAVRDPSLSASTLLIVNTTTGVVAAVPIPANDTIETATISLPVTVGDQIALVQPLGDTAVNLGDGFVTLS